MQTEATALTRVYGELDPRVRQLIDWSTAEVRYGGRWAQKIKAARFAASVKSPTDETDDLFRKTLPGYTEAFASLMRAIAMEKIGHGSFVDTEKARQNLSYVLWGAGMFGDLMGRRRLVLESKHAAPKVSADLRHRTLFADPFEQSIPQVPFEEGIQNILDRTPELAKNASLVSDVYRRHGFAMARSSSVEITRAVQRTIARLGVQGVTETTGRDIVNTLGDWTTSYSRTVYRTNLNTTYTAGRFEQLADPDIAEIMGAFMFVTSQDVDVRSGRKQDGGENHAAAHGFIAGHRDPVWRFVAPPCGYS